MRRSIIVAAAATAACLASCSPTAPAAQTSARMAGRTVNCVDPRNITGRRISGPASLSFDVGGVTYRNDLTQACPALANGAAFKIIELEVHGAQVCSGDRFRAYDPAEASAVGTGAFPRCRLGTFTAIAAR